MVIAAPLLASGQCVRFWAAGVIPKYRTLTLDAPLLVVWGPYAWIRNPLYAGNALLGCGWSLMAGWAWMPVFAAVYVIIYSLVIIPYEEQFLMSRFKDEYLSYKISTPSMIPDFSDFQRRVYRGREGFDGGRSWFMERHSLGMNLLVTALIVIRLYLI
jgi:protein-S-isoprenylcysteine O-methyltransferase Ste14